MKPQLIFTLAFFLLFNATYAQQSIQKSTFEYAEKEGEKLLLDIYQPETSVDEPRPVLIWVHGGGFSGGKRDGLQEVKLMETLAEEGYVGVSISYRLLRKGEKTGFSCDCSRADKVTVFKESAYDLWDAIYFIHSKKNELNIDPEKIIVGGSSAGAETVLNAVYMKDWLFEQPSKYDDIQPALVWSQAGAVIDERYINEHNAIPALLFHGTADKLVPYGTAPHHYCAPEKAGYLWLDGSKTIADKLKALKTSYALYTYEDAGHGIAGIKFDKMKQILLFFELAIDTENEVQYEVTEERKQ